MDKQIAIFMTIEELDARQRRIFREEMEEMIRKLQQDKQPHHANRLLTRKQVADLLGVTVQTIWTYEQEGRITRADHPGKGIRYRESDVNKLQQNGKRA